MRTLFFRKPSPATLSHFLAEQAGLAWSYSAVGATAARPPAGFDVDRTQIVLGSGEGVYRAAKSALQRWQQFKLGWVDAWRPDTPIEVGQAVAILGRAVGLWWLNGCRIVYTIDEAGATHRYGFAYGTLPGHVESGEERFLVAWDKDSGQVTYEILAFSRPSHLVTRLGYPLVRRCQKRFGKESAAVMFRAVNAQVTLPTIYQATERLEHGYV